MKRIRLPNSEFEGENDVYVLDDGRETVFVDAGAALDTVRAALDDGLADIGRTLADVDAVLLTHWHYDHAGLAGEIQRVSDATVYAHEADAALIADTAASTFDDDQHRSDQLASWGMPAEPRRELTAFLDSHDTLAGESVDVTPLSDGDTLTLAGVAFEVVHLPGHAAGLVGYDAAHAEIAATAGDDARERSNGESERSHHEQTQSSESRADRATFVGDAILPRYTPNVGGADLRVDDPLAQYVASLERLIRRDPAVAYPGHRDRIDDPAGRAATILQHHRERTRRVIDALSRLGPATPWAVSADLFGDLEAIHILHGPGEAYAHLHHLDSHGVVDRDDREYELVADPERVDLDDLFPSVEQTVAPDAGGDD